MRLTLTLLIESLDFILYLDNLFTSVSFTQALKEAFLGMTGIIRINSKGLPVWFLELKQKNREMIYNSALDKVIGGRTEQECQAGDLPKEPDMLCFLWQDNNAVIGKNLLLGFEV
jgi:hypothetical protein